MASFSYGKHSKKRIGVWIKYDRSINTDLYYLLRHNRNKRFGESIDRIIVTTEYDKRTDEVLLEIWCTSLLSFLMSKYRYNVFYVKVKVNPDWSCYEDLGTGYK